MALRCSYAYTYFRLRCDDYEDKRTVLQLAFVSVIPFSKENGVGTVSFSLLFKLFKLAETDKNYGRHAGENLEADLFNTYILESIAECKPKLKFLMNLRSLYIQTAHGLLQILLDEKNWQSIQLCFYYSMYGIQL